MGSIQKHFDFDIKYSSFPIISNVLDGVCASGLNEARLGKKYFKCLISTYSPAFKDTEFNDIPFSIVMMLGFISRLFIDNIPVAKMISIVIAIDLVVFISFI